MNLYENAGKYTAIGVWQGNLYIQTDKWQHLE